MLTWLIYKVFLLPPGASKDEAFLARFTNFIVGSGLGDERVGLLSYPVAV